MPMPAGVRAIDLMSGIPSGDVKRALCEMDRRGIERAMIDVDFGNDAARRALKDHPDRFVGSCEVDPRGAMSEVRRLVALYEHMGIVAASASPATCQVPVDDKSFYPIYAKCVELELPICVRVGVPAARVPMRAQHVERIDEVCAYFPELKLVMRDGAEPWTALAVVLMLKWPNLYYSTSTLAPGDYPADIVHYANTRGVQKVLYAGGAPAEQICRELPEVPLRDEVWPAFLRENAIRVFKLAE